MAGWLAQTCELFPARCILSPEAYWEVFRGDSRRSQVGSGWVALVPSKPRHHGCINIAQADLGRPSGVATYTEEEKNKDLGLRLFFLSLHVLDASVIWWPPLSPSQRILLNSVPQQNIRGLAEKFFSTGCRFFKSPL